MVEGWTDETVIVRSEVSTDPPAPLEDGIYGMRIADAEPRKSSKNSQMISLKLLVTHAYGGKVGDLNRTVYDNLVQSKEAAFKTKRLCLAGGFEEAPDRVNFETLSGYCEKLKRDYNTVTIYAKLARKPGQDGRMRAEVKEYLTPDEAASRTGAKSNATNEAKKSPPSRMARL